MSIFALAKPKEDGNYWFFTSTDFFAKAKFQKHTPMKYKRILLKLSGEALMGDRQYGIDPIRLAEYADDIKTIHEQGVEIAIVIGGGVGNLPLLYDEETRAAIQHHLFNADLCTHILHPILGDSAGVFGAAMLAAAEAGSCRVSKFFV